MQRWVPVDTAEKLTRPRAGLGRCVLELGCRKKRLGECSVVSTFQQQFPTSLSLTFLATARISLPASSSRCLCQHCPWPCPSPGYFLRCRFSASAAAAICLMISVFLLKTPGATFHDLNIEFLYDPVIPLLDVFPKDSESRDLILYTYVNGSVIHNSQEVGTARMSGDG